MHNSYKFVIDAITNIKYTRQKNTNNNYYTHSQIARRVINVEFNGLDKTPPTVNIYYLSKPNTSEQHTYSTNFTRENFAISFESKHFAICAMTILCVFKFSI